MIISALLLISLLALGLLWPKRAPTQNASKRWIINLGLGLLNVGIVRLSAFGLLLNAAIWAQEVNWGLLNLSSLPMLLSVVISLLLLDLAIYAQHYAFHRWRWLWRLHQIHHTDLDLDTSSAVRYHPGEILLSLGYKTIIVVIIGAHPVAVGLFEVLIFAFAAFNHSNIKLPSRLDHYLQKIVVTPDMHRIHHSRVMQESNRNFGNAMAVWDRLFGTYCQDPKHPQEKMPLGVSGYSHPNSITFFKLLLMPFRRK